MNWLYKKNFIFFAFLWILISGTGIWYFNVSSDKAVGDYAQLMAFSNDKNGNKKEGNESIKQVRSHVSKQIVYTKNGQRLQSRLSSENSELVLDKTPQGAQILEHFQEIACTMQEELFYSKKGTQLSNISESNHPIQLLRHLTAKNASYSYKSGELIAVDVELSRYLLLDHTWPHSFSQTKPLLHGGAQSIQLSLFQAAAFNAKGLQATFNDWGPE